MKIWEWKYREVYYLNWENIYCTKKIKPYIEIKWIKIPTILYTLLKFGIKDFNKYEYMWFQKISKIIDRKNLAIITLDKDWNIRQELVKNYNWKISKNLFKYDNKNNLKFI